MAHVPLQIEDQGTREQGPWTMTWYGTADPADRRYGLKTICGVSQSKPCALQAKLGLLTVFEMFDFLCYHNNPFFLNDHSPIATGEFRRKLGKRHSLHHQSTFGFLEHGILHFASAVAKERGPVYQVECVLAFALNVADSPSAGRGSLGRNGMLGRSRVGYRTEFRLAPVDCLIRMDDLGSGLVSKECSGPRPTHCQRIRSLAS